MGGKSAKKRAKLARLADLDDKLRAALQSGDEKKRKKLEQEREMVQRQLV